MTARREAPMPADLFNLDLDPNTRAKREQRAADAGLETCTHCGRGVKPGKAVVVVVTGGGATVLHPDDETEADTLDNGYMGAWLLGSTCAKQIPAEIRQTWEGWN